MAKYPDVTAGQTEACINRIGGWNKFLRFIGGEGKVVFETILTFLRTLSIPAQPNVTTSEEYFKEAGVVSMGSNFKSQFLGLEVEATEATKLAVRKLTETSLDAPILTELGDKAKLATQQFKVFLAENRKSPEWFVFYLKGRDGNLWAVGALWRSDDDGWYVNAFSVGNPIRWNAGHRVVSRN